MAKKKKAQAQSVQAKAKAMRDAQQRADRRTRNIIIATVSVIVVAIIVAMVIVVASQSKKSGANADTQVPPQYANGEPIVISHLGVGETDESLSDLEIYLSYTCSWCAYLETAVGLPLADGALAGDYNLVLQPVNTAQMPFQDPATFAALQVAAYAPDQFIDFHQSLAEFFFEALNAEDQSVIGNEEASRVKVAELASSVGVPESVIENFGGDASEYLQISTKNWGDADVEGRDGSLGTPEIVYNGEKIPWSQGEPEQILSGIFTGMDQLGYVPGQK